MYSPNHNPTESFYGRHELLLQQARNRRQARQLRVARSMGSPRTGRRVAGSRRRTSRSVRDPCDLSHLHTRDLPRTPKLEVRRTPLPRTPRVDKRRSETSYWIPPWSTTTLFPDSRLTARATSRFSPRSAAPSPTCTSHRATSSGALYIHTASRAAPPVRRCGRALRATSLVVVHRRLRLLLALDRECPQEVRAKRLASSEATAGG